MCIRDRKHGQGRHEQKPSIKKSGVDCYEGNEKEAWAYSSSVLGRLHFFWSIRTPWRTDCKLKSLFTGEFFKTAGGFEIAALILLPGNLINTYFKATCRTNRQIINSPFIYLYFIPLLKWLGCFRRRHNFNWGQIVILLYKCICESF